MSVKTFKKGEIVYKDGDKITGLYIIQSGAVSQCLQRGKKTIDLFQLSTSHVLGEQIISGQNTYPTSAVATTETKILEIPLDTFKAQYDSAPQLMKVAIKSLADRMRLATNEVRSSKLEKDAGPCPEDQVAKCFGAIFHTANHKGDKESLPGRVVIDWNLMRQYAQRVMGESPKRLEQALNILVKQQLAMYEMGKAPDNPDGPDEIQKVHFLDLSLVESFFEFYQYYYFKGGRSELLKVDELCMWMLDGLLRLCENKEPDRFGVVGVEFSKFGDYCRDELGFNLNNDHFTRLENKGVFMKRKTSPEGVLLQFELREYRSILQSWKMLREIDKWNEKGFVNMEDRDERPKKKKAEGPACPECSADLQMGAKFCHECGHKIVAAA